MGSQGFTWYRSRPPQRLPSSEIASWLQPLVENAVKHGIGGQVRGGSVTLRAELAGDDLLLTVLDDGPGPTPATRPGTGTSLADLRERLRLLYGEDSRLVAKAAPGGGFIAELRLPAGRRS
ncbi:ATP-binding protein [Sorangium sp. So ce394]|uniref:ATP-binding protein n=1 Tax=Sorangium sp. So ce394 TaxID=3133310 RepID=UPI003F5C3B4C